MPNLQRDASALGVYGIRNLSPTRHLRLGVDARLVPKSGATRHGHGGLCNEKASAGALGVVLCHQIAGNVPILGAATGQGRHQDPVGRCDGAHLQGGKKVGHLLPHGCVHKNE